MTYGEFRKLQIGDKVVIPKVGGVDAGTVCRVTNISMEYGLVAAKPVDKPLRSNMNKCRQLRRARYSAWIVLKTEGEKDYDC